MDMSSYTPENEADDSCVFKQADKLQTLMSAAKVQDVEPIWTSVFAKVKKDLTRT
jgi:large subunit ribosomal protein LP1